MLASEINIYQWPTVSNC